MGSQVIIAHKDARFLGQYLGLYHNYRPHLWYYNAGEAPTKLILEQRPGLVTRVKTEFGVENLAQQLYRGRWQGWAERCRRIASPSWCVREMMMCPLS